MSACVCMLQCLWMSEEGDRSHEIVVTGNYEPSDKDAGN